MNPKPGDCSPAPQRTPVADSDTEPAAEPAATTAARGTPRGRAARLVPGAVTRALPVLAIATIVVATVLAPTGVAHAAPPGGEPVFLAAPAANLEAVVENLRAWLIAILAGLATLFLTIGAVRYLAAGGDPGEVEKAKVALKSAAIGYALAVLAPVLVTLVGKLVSAP